MSSRPSVRVIADPSRNAALAAWREGLASDDVVVVLDPAWPDAIRHAALELLGQALWRDAAAPRDLVVFTSGSSGRPRAIHRTRQSWELSAAPFTDILGLTCDDVVAITGPLASTLFAFGAWHGLFDGCEVVTAAIADLAGHPRAHDVSIVHAVPAMVPALFSLTRRRQLPALRVLVVAGDALPAGAADEGARLGLRVVEYYGAAELSLVGFRDASADPSAPFRPFPGVEVEVRDGVLWSRSRYQLRDYLGAAGPVRRDHAGWATVGDLASGDAAGFVVRGRGDAAITTGGYTVVVEEVEQFLRALPGVAGAGVTGLPHPRLGERVVAVVQPQGRGLDIGAVRAACLQLTAPMRPRAFVLGEVPSTPTGKILRPVLRKMAAEALEARRHASLAERAS